MKSTHRDSLIVRRFLPTDSPPGLPQRPTMVSVPILDATTPTDVGVTAIATAAAPSSAPVEYDAAATLSPSPRCTSRLAFWKYRGDLSAVLSARATKNTDSVGGMDNPIKQ